MVVTVSAAPEPQNGYSYSSPSQTQFHGSSITGTSFNGFNEVGFNPTDFGNGNSFSGISHNTGSDFFSQITSSPNGYGDSANGFHGASAAPPQQVFKHVYVHTAPDEPEEIRPPKPIPVRQAEKHFKLIFIKAPTPPTPTAPVIPVQPQNEEKTLVYVLVKKPEKLPDIVIPTPPATPPTKPEIYFIRYRTRTERVPIGYPTSAPTQLSKPDFFINYDTGKDTSFEPVEGYYLNDPNDRHNSVGLAGTGAHSSTNDSPDKLNTGVSSLSESSQSAKTNSTVSVEGTTVKSVLSRDSETTESNRSPPASKYGPPGLKQK